MSTETSFPNPKRGKFEDKDENCRLRYGLNVHCLAEIFQYLNSDDLYTVGEMNEFYRQIINDLVISKHEVDFNKLFERYIKISKMFDRYGTKIRKFYFSDYENNNGIHKLVQLITKYCAIDQLKSVRMNCQSLVNLPIQFKNIELFDYTGKAEIFLYEPHLYVPLSESLRYLRLANINLDPNFDWTKLKNLTQLYLKDVYEINEENFIEFLKLRPKLEAFQHDGFTFEDSTANICKMMAKYCGNHIQYYSGELLPVQDDSLDGPVRDLYGFLSGFKNVKMVSLTSHQVCGGDLFDSMKRLTENNTVEMLSIEYSEEDYILENDVYCIFQEHSNLRAFNMNKFRHLKTIEFVRPVIKCDIRHGKMCHSFKLLSVYSSQILWNVENLSIRSIAQDCNIIKFAPKLRRLGLNIFELTSSQATEILSMLESIFLKRNNGPNKGDLIEIKFENEDNLKLFAEIDGRKDFIKLSEGCLMADLF